jgi:hypothetical protein
MSIIVIENQSLLDISIEKNGNVLTLFDLALKNNLSITDDLYPGQKLNEVTTSVDNNNVKNYFIGKKQKVATSVSADLMEILNPQLGIGKMAIGSTFIIR